MRLALALAVALLLPAGAAQATAPQVRLVAKAPVRIAGTGFQRAERVTVRVAVSDGSSYARTVRATSTGRLDVRFLGHTLAPCYGYTLTAVGRAGSRATKKVPASPVCGVYAPP